MFTTPSAGLNPGTGSGPIFPDPTTRPDVEVAVEVVRGGGRRRHLDQSVDRHRGRRRSPRQSPAAFRTDRPTRRSVAFSVLFALIFLHVLSDHGACVLDHHDGQAAHIAASAVGDAQVEQVVQAPPAPPHPTGGHSSCDLSVARSGVVPLGLGPTGTRAENPSLPSPTRELSKSVQLDHSGWAPAPGSCVIRV